MTGPFNLYLISLDPLSRLVFPAGQVLFWNPRSTRSQNAPFHLQSEALWRTYNECFLLLTLCSFFLHISSISSFVLLRSFLSTPKSLFIFSPPFFFTQILYSYMLYLLSLSYLCCVLFFLLHNTSSSLSLNKFFIFICLKVYSFIPRYLYPINLRLWCFLCYISQNVSALAFILYLHFFYFLSLLVLHSFPLNRPEIFLLKRSLQKSKFSSKNDTNSSQIISSFLWLYYLPQTYIHCSVFWVSRKQTIQVFSQSWELNPHPLEHESSPITTTPTTPGLPPQYIV